MKALNEIFNIRYGHSLELNRLNRTSAENGISFISRKMGDNGIAAYVERIPGVEPNPAGELTCALSGNGVLTTFIQDKSYYTGFHIACLSPKIDLTKQELLYYSVCIKANRYRFSWGRQANRTLKNILVPCEDDLPDWVNSVNPDMYDGADTPYTPEPSLVLTTSEWQPFKLSNIFSLRKGKRLTKANMTIGNIPFIGATDSKNGITAMIGQTPIHDGNTISVSYNGSVAEAFYQPTPFWATDDVNVLYPNFDMTPAVALFLCTVIRQEKYRFNYGRKWHLERMEQSVIKLPTDQAWQPDWDFMENYIKTLPFSSQL